MSSHVHDWYMADIHAGYLVFEGCHECGARTSFFSEEPVPPVDEYREGRHYWIYQGSFQAARFALRCATCDAHVDLKDMSALMLSSCEDPECEVGRLNRDVGGNSWVYVALCSNSAHTEGRCVGPDSIAALNEYFNQGLGASDRKVVVVPCRMCDNIDRCRGTVLADAGLTDIY